MLTLMPDAQLKSVAPHLVRHRGEKRDAHDVVNRGERARLVPVP